MSFDEHSEKAQSIMTWYEDALHWFAEFHNISFKDPPHDIARRFLNEIVEFKSVEE